MSWCDWLMTGLGGLGPLSWIYLAWEMRHPAKAVPTEDGQVRLLLPGDPGYDEA